jgi:hypothetical protein
LDENRCFGGKDDANPLQGPNFGLVEARGHSPMADLPLKID